jgi:hypothetical protein
MPAHHTFRIMMAAPTVKNNYCCSSPSMERKFWDLEDPGGAAGCFAKLSPSDPSNFRCVDSKPKDLVQRKGIFTSTSPPETFLDEDDAMVVRYQSDLGRTKDYFSWYRRATISSAYPATEALEKALQEEDWDACSLFTSKRARNSFVLGFILDSDEVAADKLLSVDDLCKISIGESERNLGKTLSSKRQKLTRTKRCAELKSEFF